MRDRARVSIGRGRRGLEEVQRHGCWDLPIRVDKSHLITIGERLYTESVELIRELVNNAYDADATEVHVTIDPQEVRVSDDGLGMDLDGLREYFTIGTPDKTAAPALTEVPPASHRTVRDRQVRHAVRL